MTDKASDVTARLSQGRNENKDDRRHDRDEKGDQASLNVKESAPSPW